MGLCNTKPKVVYIVYQSRTTILCTYDINRALTLVKGSIPDRELIAYYPDDLYEPPLCIKQTYRHL